MVANHIIIAVLWIVYCLLHSLLASIGFKKKLKSKLGSHYKYYRLAYTLFSFLSLVGLIYYQLNIPTLKLYNSQGFVFIAGLIISVSGVVLMFICIKKYFIGLSGLLSLTQENTHQNLLITGVHKYVRHPLYLGTFAFIWGLFFVLPFLSFLIANVIITAYTLIGINLEEKKLIIEFGESYRVYQKKVPKLIPHGSFQQDFYL